MAISNAAVACSVAATISAFFSLTALAAKPAGNGGTDPCLAGSPNWVGFPAYAYFTNVPGGGTSSDPYEVRVASANGRCSLRVLTIPENALSVSFAESSVSPGLYRLVAAKYLFMDLAEFRIGTDPATGRPRLETLNVTQDFRPPGTQFGYSGADLSPDGDRIAMVRYFGFDRRITVADFDDSTPDVDVCAVTGLNDFPGDWGNLAWAPSGRISFVQHSDQFLRLVGVDGNAPQTIEQCDPALVVSFREGSSGSPVPVGEPYLVSLQRAWRDPNDVEYLALRVSFQEMGRKGLQTGCGVWVWDATEWPATRVLDRTNGAPRGSFPSFTRNGSLLYQPDTTSGCNPPYAIGEFSLFGVAISIEETVSGRWPAALK